MKKNVQRILSVFLAALMLAVVAIPVHALPVPGTLYETTDFYNSIYTAFLKWKAAHPDSDDSEYSGYGGGAGRGGGFFGEGSGQFDKAAYDDYVTTLPATGYDSSGKLRYSPAPAYIYAKKYGSYGTDFYEYCEHSPEDVEFVDFSENGICICQFDCASNALQVLPCSGKSGFSLSTVSFNYCFIAPVDGYYSRLSTLTVNGYMRRLSDGKNVSFDTRYSSTSSMFYSAGYSFIVEGYGGFVSSSLNYALARGLPPIYEVTPSSSLSDTTYNINTRPTSITGGNYGIVGDNGQITKVEDNSTIINETNNTYYNPATGQTVPITGWTYDYSDRSYKVTMEGGKTSTVTYGDENISITETTVNESGDTITNNYTIYYLVDGSGSENPPCEHDWQESSSTDPTCTLPGKVTLSCTKCQQTKTETVPALGHDWQVKQTVTTQYDEEGNLTQQGYTIFECSRCHEQYKSTDGTIPPGGGSGTDPGGEEGETTIGGLIEKLLSGVGSIVGGIIKGLLSLLTKAVEALAGLAELFTTFVGSLVELWGGFTSFLSAVFPFLPEEFVIIIELGLILMIAAAVFRKFIS